MTCKNTSNEQAMALLGLCRSLRKEPYTLDVISTVEGVISPFKSIADEIADAYRNHLYGHATLQDLPSDNQGPRFVINATNVQTKVLWRFSKPYMDDPGSIRGPGERCCNNRPQMG